MKKIDKKNEKVKKIDNLLTKSAYFQQEKLIQKLREREIELFIKNSIFDNSIAANSICDLDLNLTEVNIAGIKLLGYSSRRKIIGKNLIDFISDKNEVNKIALSLKKFNRWEGRFQMKKKDGTVIDVHGTASSIFDLDKKIIGYQSSVIDITDVVKNENSITKVNRLLRMMKSINNILVSTNDEIEILSLLCSLLVKDGGYFMSFVGFAINDKDKSINPVARAGHDDGFIDKLKLSWAEDTENGKDPVGIAVRTKKYFLVNDIKNSPIYSARGKNTLENGFKSVIAIPFNFRKDNFGVIFIASDKVNFFIPEEVKLLNDLVKDVSDSLYNRNDKNETEKLKTAVSSSSDIIYMTDKEGIITYINTKFTETYGYTRDEVINKKTPRILKSGDRSLEEYEDFWSKLLMNKKVNDEHTNVTKDGKIILVESSTNQIHNKKNEIIGFMAIQRDITKRKELESKILLGENRLKQIINLIPQFVFAKNYEGEFILVNKAIADIYGTTVDKLIGKKDTDFAKNIEEVIAFRKADLSVMNSGLLLDIPEENITDALGNIHKLHTVKIPFSFSGTKELAILGVSEDITNIKNEEKVIIDMINRDEAILGSIHDAVYAIDNKGNYLLSNTMAENLLGYSKGELSKSFYKDVILLMNETGGQPNFNFINEILNKNSIVSPEVPVLLRRKDGSSIPVFIISSPILNINSIYNNNNNNNDNIGRVLVFRDISREKELEQAKNDFLSLTSHQLRTPLSITKWVIEAFGHDVTLNSKQKDRLNDLFVSNERLINLVNKLLNVTRLESGKLIINKEKVDLKKLIVELCLSLNKFSQNKNKIIKLNIPTVIESINCDPILIHEALENLIVNAINYSPYDTEDIIVSIVDSGNEYLVSVHNDGVMEEALIERIGKYEKFYRGDKATKSLPAGSGLGLYVTKKVIEASGGTFGFESNKKIGTIFNFTIIK